MGTVNTGKLLKKLKKGKYDDSLTPNAFRRRFTKDERKNMRKSNLDDVQDVYEGMQYVPYVDVTHPLTIADMQTLVDNAVITAERMTELLQPPHPLEKFEPL